MTPDRPGSADSEIHPATHPRPRARAVLTDAAAGLRMTNGLRRGGSALRSGRNSLRPAAAALSALVLASCASASVVDPLQDDGSAGFAAACVGVLAAERAAAEATGGAFSVDGHRALNEWMFQASRRRSLFDDEIGRAAERRRWAETLPAPERARRAAVCLEQADT